MSLMAEATTARRAGGLGQRILQAFEKLPGRTALSIWVPAVDDAGAWSLSLHPDRLFFCASAFKAFVLAEYLRQTDAGTAPLTELLPVDESVWSLSSPVLTADIANGLTGLIEARTALEAMISHSDNTGTDIALKRAGADRVRALIRSLGLRDTRIPNATRQMFGYLAEVSDWETITWKELLAALETLPPTGPSLVNDVQTMASTANDFVTFYSRALQGELFENAETLTTFRSILALAEDIPMIMPLGVNAFHKSGSIDFRREHALTLAGGVFIPDRRWAYYSFLINWVDGEGGSTGEVRPLGIAVLRNIFAWLTDAFGTCC